MNVRMSISVTPELYFALTMASTEKETSMSRVVETMLRESNDLQRYIASVRVLADRERDIDVSAASTGKSGAFHRRRVQDSGKEEREWEPVAIGTSEGKLRHRK